MAGTEEGSLDSTARSRRLGARLRGGRTSPAPWRVGEPRSEGSGEIDSSEEAAAALARGEAAVAVARADAARQRKLHNKLMLLHFKLASPEEKEAMLEPTGWRPELRTDMSLEMQIRILKARLDARLPSSPPRR
jgi:hypothetical protein